MPCVLKYPEKNSPGILVFSSNEYFFGILKRDKKVQNLLSRLDYCGHWLFGVHINGSFHSTELQFEKPISFVLCADASVDFLGNCSIPVIELTAEFFIDVAPSTLAMSDHAQWDIVIISRISEAKRFSLALDLLEDLYSKRPKLRVCIVAQSNSRSLSEKLYVLAAAKRMRALLRHDLTLFVSQVELFGGFPITKSSIHRILVDSSLLFIASAREGGPRVLAEAATFGVKCVVFEDLISNLKKYFHHIGVKVVSSTASKAADQILHLLDCQVNVVGKTDLFSDKKNREKLKDSLVDLLKKKGFTDRGLWHLSNLSQRLPGHSRLGDQQIIYNPKLMLRWLNLVNSKRFEFDADKFFLDNSRLYLQPISSKLTYGLFWFFKLLKSKLNSILKLLP